MHTSSSSLRPVVSSSTPVPSDAPANRYWYVQLHDPGDELFGSRAARFAFLNIWRIYIAACYPTCAYVLIPGYFASIIEAPGNTTPAELKQAISRRISTKLNGLFPACVTEEAEQLLQLRELRNVKECIHCTFDLHTLPQRYRISTDYRSYPFSSYRALSVGMSSSLKHKTVFDWFGGQLRFGVFHQAYYGWMRPRYEPELPNSVPAYQVAED
ncbi:MAG: hypothetical protein ACOC2C_08990 [Cyclonatronaceae bacterium]